MRWCLDAHFQDWIAETFVGEDFLVADKTGEELAKAVICLVCKIDSRKQLETAPGADMLFRSKILEPYAKARAADGIDEE